jgi:hypothetical protein
MPRFRAFPLTRVPWLTVVLLAIGLGSPLGANEPAAVFEGKDTLRRPQGYRQWVFVGSSLGLRYSASPQTESPGAAKTYKHVYIDPLSFRHFAKTGQFPDGTVMILEVATAEEKNDPQLTGSYPERYVGLEASVKDRSRFEGGWAYFSFDGPDGPHLSKAQPLPGESCLSCHRQKAETDHVFTQFYPVLRAALANRNSK